MCRHIDCNVVYVSLRCPVFLDLGWSRHSAQYKSITSCCSISVFEHLSSFTSFVGLRRDPLELFSLVPQGFSKTCVISCGPEIASFSCKRRKKRSQCFLWLHKVYFRNWNLCFFFFFFYYSLFSLLKNCREWLGDVCSFAPRKCFFYWLGSFKINILWPSSSNSRLDGKKPFFPSVSALFS